jgi:uncharacterized membrane protein
MGLLCLLVAAIMWMVADRWHPRVVVVLVLAGMSGLAGSGLGNWIHRTAVYLDAAAGKFIGQFTGTAITGLVAILALALVVVGLWKDKVTGKTIVAAMFVPVTVAMVPGMVGQASTSAVTALASAVASVGGALFGIR